MQISQDDLIDKINQLHSALGWLRECTKDVTVSNTSSQKVSLTLFFLQLTQIRVHSILVLLENFLPTGAFTLARSSLESYVRAIWVSECAKDEKISSIIADKKDFPRISCAIKQIAIKKSDHARWLLKAKEKLSFLHDWAHGGLQTYVRNFDGRDIQPRFHISHQFDLLDTFLKPIVFGSGIKLLEELGLHREPIQVTFARVLGQELDIPDNPQT